MSLFSPIEMDAEYNCVIMVILRTAVITTEIRVFSFFSLQNLHEKGKRKNWGKNMKEDKQEKKKKISIGAGCSSVQ